MAERRMICKQICETDKFYALPATEQALFFHLQLNADDEGFVRNVRSILSVIKNGKKSMEGLINHGYVIRFDSGVVVMRHWGLANKVEPSKFHPTGCVEERQLLTNVNGIYIFDEEKEQYRVKKHDSTRDELPFN